MKIKTQFRMTMFLFGSVVTAALALVIVTDNQAKRVTNQAALAAGVAQGANELSYLSNDYLIYREEQQIARWRSSFVSLLNQVKGLSVDTPEEQMLVRNINENTRRLKETFDSVLAVAPNSPRNRSGGLDSDFLKISSSRLAVQTQGLFSDAQRLSRLIEARADRLRETRTMLVYALLCLFGLFLLANYALTYRRTMRSMAKLQAGARIIGSGNVAFRIKKERNDEIGELSDAFNQMTAGLKTVTASKNDLEKEIEERKQAEEERDRLLTEVKAERDRLSALVASIRDEVWFADTQKRFTLANPAALREFGLNTDDAADVEKLADSLEVLRPDGSPRPVEEAPPLRALKGEIITNQEEIIRTPSSGELRYRQVSAAPVRDGQGNIIGSVSVAHDITERKKAEDEISRSKKTFAELVERAPFGIYTVDSQFRIAQMNIGSQTGAFRNVRPVIGRDFAEAMRILWPEPVAGEIIAKFRHTLETGEPYYSPRFVNPRHDVEFVESYEWELHRMMLPDGEYGVICYYFDSTKLREAEEALRQSKERLRLALTAANLGTWDYNPVTGALVWDTRCKELFGLPPETEVDYDTFLAGLHPEDRDRANEVVQHTFDPAGDGFFEIEYRTVGPRDGGMLRWIRATGRAWFNNAGQATRFTGTVQDITERNHAEEALRESEQKYRNLFENMAEEVHFWQIVRDESGQIRTWRLVDANPPTLKSWGRSTVGEIRGKTTDEIFGPGATEHYMPVVRKIMTEGIPYSFEDYFPNLDKHFRFTSVPLGNYFITTGADITGIKKAEAALRQSLSEKEVLLKEIHHRVKNNMQVISSLVSLQAEELQDAATRDILDEVTHRVRSMALVHEKLYQSADLSQIDFAGYAKSLLGYLWRAYGTAASDIRLVMDVEPVLLTVNSAVPCGLILNELVSNTLKHAFRARRDGEVTVSIHSAQGMIRLSVRDDGTGLPEGFDWKQAHSLGLRLVQMLAGQLHAEVELDRKGGTEFKITFGQAESQKT